ncbi:hypothetical protein SASPL_120380 [Salvia splendens]|uniref:Chromo domain-containing protein n=1 Tax=Salvia splendens TaxID=180675 RepID=A0A8X8XQE4_SALSN|nr:hypothetical protein SASPL_120380 [Salvia splendens]
MLELLRHHLRRAQDRMVASANKRRRDVEYCVGDMVYLRFRPHRQSSLFSTRNRKLAPRFCGPFKIEARIGATAYRLQLPDSARIHPVFHVSLLKRAVGDAPVETTLPDSLVDAAPPFLPDKVLARRTERRDDDTVDQVLIGWVGLGDDEATWMDEADVLGQFPFFNLADKAVPTGGAIDTVSSLGGWKVYTRRNKGKDVGGSEEKKGAGARG